MSTNLFPVKKIYFFKFKYFFSYPNNCKGIGEIWCRLAKKFDSKIFNFLQKVVQIDIEKKEVEKFFWHFYW